jgi:hypothetical protein
MLEDENKQKKGRQPKADDPNSQFNELKLFVS